MLNPGIKGSASVAVTAANTAAAMGSAACHHRKHRAGHGQR